MLRHTARRHFETGNRELFNYANGNDLENNEHPKKCVCSREREGREDYDKSYELIIGIKGEPIMSCLPHLSFSLFLQIFYVCAAVHTCDLLVLCVSASKQEIQKI